MKTAPLLTALLGILAITACSSEPQKAAPNARKSASADAAPKSNTAEPSAAQPAVSAVKKLSPLPEQVAAVASSVLQVATYTGTSGLGEGGTFPYEGLTPHRRGLGVVVEKDDGKSFVVTSYSLLATDDAGSLAPVVDLQPLGAGTHVAGAVVSVERTLDLAIIEARLPKTVVPSRLDAPSAMAAGTRLHAITDRVAASISHVSGVILELPDAECYQRTLLPTMLEVEFEDDLSLFGAPLFGDNGALLAFRSNLPVPPEKDEHEDSEHKDSEHEDSEHEDGEHEAHVLPIELVYNIYDSLKTRRSTNSPWTGFSVRALSARELAVLPRQGFDGGIALEDVWERSPAEALGLQIGDVLLSFGEHPIKSVADFQRWLYMHGVGETVTLKFLRGTKVFEHSYTIEERPRWAVPR